MDNKKNCTNCEWFESWRSVSEDELEDDDAGRCTNELNNTGVNQELFVDYSYVCDKHKIKTMTSNTSRFDKSHEQIIQIYKSLLEGGSPVILFHDDSQEKLDLFCNKFYSAINEKIELVLITAQLYSIKLKA